MSNPMNDGGMREVTEKAAIAIFCQDQGYHRDHWDELLTEDERDHYIRCAEAALAAMPKFSENDLMGTLQPERANCNWHWGVTAQKRFDAGILAAWATLVAKLPHITKESV